jgi:hypothetical protein
MKLEFEKIDHEMGETFRDRNSPFHDTLFNRTVDWLAVLVGNPVGLRTGLII